MNELASQWPLVALVLAIVLGAGRIIQGVYLERIKEAREDMQFWRELALSGTQLSERLTNVVEHTTTRRAP